MMSRPTAGRRSLRTNLLTKPGHRPGFVVLEQLFELGEKSQRSLPRPVLLIPQAFKGFGHTREDAEIALALQRGLR
jgi:hypothetical protein